MCNTASSLMSQEYTCPSAPGQPGVSSGRRGAVRPCWPSSSHDSAPGGVQETQPILEGCALKTHLRQITEPEQHNSDKQPPPLPVQDEHWLGSQTSRWANNWSPNSDLLLSESNKQQWSLPRNLPWFTSTSKDSDKRCSFISNLCTKISH